MSATSPVRKPDQLWTIDFVLNLLAAHSLFVAYSSLFTVIPLYVLYRGGEKWHIGVVFGAFGVVALVIRPLAGRWIHRWGSTRIAVGGMVVLGLGSFMYIPASTLWWLLPVRMFQGIGLAMGPVATSTIVADLAPLNRRAEAMGYMGNAVAVSNLYAPLVGYLLLSRFGFSASFTFSAFSALLAAVLASRISIGRRRSDMTDDMDIRVPLISQPALFPTVVFLSYTLAMGPVGTFLPILAEDRELGNPGLYFTVNSLTSIFAMSWSGRVADKVGRSTVIIPGLLLAASAMFLLSMAPNQVMFLGAALLAGMGFGLLHPGIQSLTVDRVSPRERSAALATLQSAWDLGGSGGALILGPIAGMLSVATTFGIVGVVTLVGAGGFVFGNRKKRTQCL